MGLAKLLTRAIEYQVTNTETGHTELFTVNGSPPLAPDWPTDDYRGAMGIPGAWRAAVLVSDLLGQVPWEAYRERAGQAPEKLPRTPVLLEQPAPPATRMETFSSLALDLIWHGNCGGPVAARDGSGVYPTAFFPVPAQDIYARRVTPRAYSSLPIGEVEYKIGPLQLSHWDVVHIKGPVAPGGLRGMGVLEVHLQTLQLAKEQQRQAGALAHHGVPSGIIKSANPDLTETEAEKLKDAWMRAQSTRRPMVLNPSTEFEPIAWNPEQMQLVEARRLTREDLALIFGIPPYWLGVEAGSMTYSNAEQQWLDLIKTTLGGHLARFEQTLSQLLPRGTRVEANLDAFLRSDTLTRYQAHVMGIRAGFLTRDEVREIEGRPPLPKPDPPAGPTPPQPGDDPQQEGNPDE